MTRPLMISVPEWSQRCARILEEIRTLEPFSLVDPAEPWSAASLDATEQRMLGEWPSIDDVPSALCTQYEAFLGEGLRRRFDGVWTVLHPEMLGDTSGDDAQGFGIAYPGSGMIDVVSSLVPHAYRSRQGTWWSSCFEATEQLRAQVEGNDASP